MFCHLINFNYTKIKSDFLDNGGNYKLAVDKPNFQEYFLFHEGVFEHLIFEDSTNFVLDSSQPIQNKTSPNFRDFLASWSHNFRIWPCYSILFKSRRGPLDGLKSGSHSSNWPEHRMDYNSSKFPRSDILEPTAASCRIRYIYKFFCCSCRN